MIVGIAWLVGTAATIGFIFGASLKTKVEYIYIEDDGEGGARQRPAPGLPVGPSPDFVPNGWTHEHAGIQ